MEKVDRSRSSFESVGFLRNGDPSIGRCRILFLIGEMVAGGQEQQLCNLLRGLDRDRYRPALVVWNYRDSDVHIPKVKDLGIPLWGYPVEASSYWKLLDFRRFVKALKPEIVHSFGFYTNFAAFVAAQAAGAIGIGSIQNEINASSLMAERPVLGRLSASLPRHQISNSQAAAKRISDRTTWFKPSRLHIMTNPIDLEEFRREPVPLKTPHQILGIGSLVPFKRWDRLLRLAQELKRRNLPVVVRIAGDGPLRQELGSMAVELGISDMTHFLGHRLDVSDLIAASRLVVHTSDAEGTPNVVMEAVASGRPVVATDVGDVRALIEDGRTGFVVNREDFASLTERVVDIITDDGLAQRLGQSASEFAQREFSMLRPVKEAFDAYGQAGWKP